jgi:hypothetical protein
MDANKLLLIAMIIMPAQLTLVMAQLEVVFTYPLIVMTIMLARPIPAQVENVRTYLLCVMTIISAQPKHVTKPVGHVFPHL